MNGDYWNRGIKVIGESVVKLIKIVSLVHERTNGAKLYHDRRHVPAHTHNLRIGGLLKADHHISAIFLVRDMLFLS
jgi:urease accessory protein UreH